MDKISSLVDVEDAAPQTFLPNSRRKSLIEIEAFLTNLTPSGSTNESDKSHDHVIDNDVDFFLLDSSQTMGNSESECKRETTDSVFSFHLYSQPIESGSHRESTFFPHSFRNYPKDNCCADDLFSCYTPSDPSLFTTNVRDSRSSTTSTVFSFEDGFSLSSTSTQPLQLHACSSPCSSTCTLLTMSNIREREKECYPTGSDNEFESDPWCRYISQNNYSSTRYPSSSVEIHTPPYKAIPSEIDCCQIPHETMLKEKIKREKNQIAVEMDQISCSPYLADSFSNCWMREDDMKNIHYTVKEQSPDTPTAFYNDPTSNSTVQGLFSTSPLVNLPIDSESSYSLIPSRRTSRQTYPHCSTYKHSYRSEPQRERIHRCPVQDCLKAYTKSSHLRAHMKMHTGEKPHACEFCGRRYVRKDELKRHQIQHTGEKRYSCFVCGKKFGRSDHAKKHVEIKHPSQLLELENRRSGGRIRWDSQ